MTEPYRLLRFPLLERSPNRMSGADETNDSRYRDPERRRTTRYSISLPVHYDWQQENGAVKRSSAFTRNIGSQGISVVGEVVPPEGASIDITVILPGRAARRGIRVQMRGRGAVVRVDPGGCFSADAAFRIVRVREAGDELIAPELD